VKRLSMRIILVAAAVIGIAAPAAQAQVGVNVTIGGFYDELAPYGRWVDCRYGRCWVPARVAADWQPYSNGQWIYTEYGWTWISNDPWGGSPYHYGTWTSIEGYGWSWVPGTVWAPAWVTWSYSNDYVGWAPLPPTVVFGAYGYARRPVGLSQTQYVFLPTNRFVGGNVTAVRIPARQSAEIFRQTRPVTGFSVSGGIVRNMALPMTTIEHAAGRKIETRSIQGAGTAARAFSPGTAHLSVVAPASEVRAAAAARPQAASRPPEPPQQERHAKAPVDQKSGSVKAPNAHDAPPPAQSRHPAAEAPAEHRQEPPGHAVAPPKAREAPPAEPRRPAAEAPAEHRQEPPHRAEASQPAKQAPKPPPKSVKEKPAEKDKKPDEEKH
jgi:hypothetical protein